MLNCRRCGGSTIMLDSFDEYPDEDHISNYEDGEVWHVCHKCDAWHLECPTCSKNHSDERSRLGLKTLCRFIGHSGCYKNSIELRIPPFASILRYNPTLAEVIRQHVLEYDSDENLPESENNSSVEKLLNRGGVRKSSTWYPHTHSVEILGDCACRSFLKDFPGYASDFPMYYMGDKNRYYAISNSTISLTGPDGGDVHYWKCFECDKMFEFTDK